MAVLPNISIVTPTLGGSSGQWDDLLNSALALIDAHDHSSGKGLAINTDAITIDADLTVAGYSLTNVGKVSFTAITAPVSGSKNLFVNTSDNELYWRTNAGTNVKLTSGTTLNVSLIGGIAGDYTAVSAQVAFDDANGRYTFKNASATGWSRLACGPVRIYEYNTSESVYVEHAVAAALASSYTVTWPAALPGSTVLVQISSAGVVSFSNTVANAATFSSTVTATDYKLSVARRLNIPGSAYTVSSGATTCIMSSGAIATWSLGNQNTEVLKVPICLGVGDRVTSFTVYAYKTSDATDTFTVELVKYTSATGARAVLATGTNAADAPGAITITPSVAPSETLAAAFSYQLEITRSDASPSGAGADVIANSVIDYDRP